MGIPSLWTMLSHPSHYQAMCSGTKSRADGSETETRRDATPELCAWHITGWCWEPEEETLWRENSCVREKRWRDCLEVVESRMEEREEKSKASPLDSLFSLTIHCIWARGHQFCSER